MGHMEQIKVIVAGYDHYEGVDVNPSYQVSQALADHGMEGMRPVGPTEEDPLEGVDLAISSVTMPVSFAKAWPILHEAIERVQPDIIIATGLKRRARGIAMERCAVNLKEDDADDADDRQNSGKQEPRGIVCETGRQPIDPQGPAAYWTRLPLRAILHDFGTCGIPATLSSDAGTYVCNALFYNLLAWAAGHTDVLAGFVSLPLVNEGGGQEWGLPLNQQIQAVREVVNETIRYYRRPSSSPILIA